MSPVDGYLHGFGNEFSSEAVSGALPQGRNSPQRPPFGLYAEQLSGTAFTAPRHANRRSWLYRVRPSADHGPFRELATGALETGPFTSPPSPNRLRWGPLARPDSPSDFVEGLFTYGGNGAPESLVGVGIHGYVATRSMERRAFFDADGELLVVPQEGTLTIVTELGRMVVEPSEIAVIPRGVRFRVIIDVPCARGYVCENYGAPFRLPELGPIGSNGLANPRDFSTPRAAFETDPGPYELVQKFHGGLFTTTIDHSPFDVVAWHGNYAPYKYDLRRFNTIGTVSFDHPDPSIFTVLTSPTDSPGTANVDFVIFPPRWMVGEDTFRPPWFHRNVMSEFMGLIHGVYDAKAGGFVPGGASLHNCMSAHGPDVATTERAMSAALAPHKIDGTLAFMFETRLTIRTTPRAMATSARDLDYDACWRGFPPARVTPG